MRESMDGRRASCTGSRNQHGLTATASHGNCPEATGKVPYKNGLSLPGQGRIIHDAPAHRGLPQTGAEVLNPCSVSLIAPLADASRAYDPMIERRIQKLDPAGSQVAKGHGHIFKDSSLRPVVSRPASQSRQVNSSVATRYGDARVRDSDFRRFAPVNSSVDQFAAA